MVPDNVYRRAFQNAFDEVQKIVPQADWMLKFGGLDCSQCGEAMQKLAGIDMKGKTLTAEEVQQLTIAEYESELDPWAYHSALKFIETCQEQNLGIKFSW